MRHSSQLSPIRAQRTETGTEQQREHHCADGVRKTIGALPNLSIEDGQRNLAAQPRNYRVLVDDNFNFMKQCERYEYGRYPSLKSAVEACRRIVEEDLCSYAD